MIKNIPKRRRVRTKPPKVQSNNTEILFTYEQLEDMLHPRHKRFSHEYIRFYNATQSYKKVYGDHLADNVAGACACQLLRNPKVKQYIEYIKEDIAKEVGISKIALLQELKIIALTSPLEMYDSWITRKELEEIQANHPHIGKAIQEVSTKVVTKLDDNKEPWQIEYVKVKFYDKLRAIESIFKAMGWNEPEKVDINQNLLLGQGSVTAIRQAFGLDKVNNPMEQ